MPGWTKFKLTASGIGVLLALGGAGIAAEPVEDADLPAGFLEFLAEWENEQGEWQDPIEYEDPHWQSLDEEAGQSDE